MQDTTWIATIAGLALGIGIILAIIYLKDKDDGSSVTYSYDENNRLTTISPTKFVQLKPMEG